MTDVSEIAIVTSTDGIDWAGLKAALAADAFDNGRSPEQLRGSFENTRHVAFAVAGDEVVGTARALSDGVCNAYIVDVWTRSDLRRRGIGRRMMASLLERLGGQHVHLVADAAGPFYDALGFRLESGGGRSLIVGQWLRPD